MKQSKRISNKYKNNGVKRPAAGWFIVFGAALLLFAAIIFIGIKAGEYAETARDSGVTVTNEVSV